MEVLPCLCHHHCGGAIQCEHMCVPWPLLLPAMGLIGMVQPGLPNTIHSGKNNSI